VIILLRQNKGSWPLSGGNFKPLAMMVTSFHPSYPYHNLKSTLGFSGLIVKEAGFIKNRMQTSPWDMQLPASNLSYR